MCLVRDDQAVAYQLLVVDGFDRRFLVEELDSAGVCTLTADGVFPAIDTQSSYIYGATFNSQRHAAQRYRVALAVATWLEVKVAAVSQQGGARFVVRLAGDVKAQLA